MDSLARKMQRVCQICGDVAKSMHFGGLSCDSCKAFFRRSVQNDAFRHFRCGGDKQCNISIASRKFCKYCRFNKCEQVGMVKAWVMSEEERVQLMKSRLNKKLTDTGDEESLRDDLYSSYKGRVALTAGGAPNLHGLNRRRHMECRMREEGEVDPSLYASASKTSTSPRKKDKDREPGEVDPSTYQSSAKSSAAAAARRKNEREPGEVDPSIYGSAVRKRKSSSCQPAELNLFACESSSERSLSRETDSSYSKDSELVNDMEDDDDEMCQRDGGSTRNMPASFGRSCSPSHSSDSSEDDARDNLPRNDSMNQMDNRMSDSVERNIDCRSPDSNYGRNSPVEKMLSRPSSDSCLDQSISNDNSPFLQMSSFTPESNSSSKSSITDQQQFPGSYPMGLSSHEFDLANRNEELEWKNSLAITDMPHQHQISEYGPQFPSKQHSSSRRLSSSLTSRPNESRHRASDYSNKENDALFLSLGLGDDYVSSSSSSVCRETKPEDVDSMLSDNNDNYALQEDKEGVALRSFPIEPDKYIVMINERPEVPITNYMSRGELIKLKSIVRNMQMMEKSLPYSVTLEGSVMDHYSHFIRRVTFFLNQFEEFNSWSKLDRERAIKQNITVIALVFGSSFMKKGGTYKNTLHNPSEVVTNMTTIRGTLTPNVFDTFNEVLGILGQFEVDIRMGYMLIFNIIFDPEKNFEANQCYGQLLYKYICWKYGAANAATMNYNLFKALEGIRKHAYVFESMSANANQRENDGCARIMDGSDICIKTENPDMNTDSEDAPSGQHAVNSSDSYKTLREMYYSGASMSEMSLFYHGSVKSQTQNASPREDESSTSPHLPILSEIPQKQWNDTEDTITVGGVARSPSQNFTGGPLTQGIQESMARFGGDFGGGRNQNLTGLSMSKGIGDMMNKHGAAKLKEMYEKGQISDLKAMFHQNKSQQQPSGQWSSMSVNSTLQHQDLSKYKEMYQGGGSSSGFDGKAKTSGAGMDINSEHYAGKLGKFRQMMAQQHGMDVDSAVANQLVDNSTSLKSDFKMNQLLNSTPLSEIENDNKNNFSEASFGGSHQGFDDRTEISSQDSRLKPNLQDSSKRLNYDPHVYSPPKYNPGVSTVTNPGTAPNVNYLRCDPLISPPACSDAFSRLSTKSISPNHEATMEVPRNTFLKSPTSSTQHATPQGAHHQPSPLPQGAHIQSSPLAQGAHHQPSTLPQSAHIQAISLAQANHYQASPSQQGTHHEASPLQQGTHIQASSLPQGAYQPPSSSLPHQAPRPSVGDLFLDGAIQTRPYHPQWGPDGMPFNTGLQSSFPIPPGQKPFEFAFNTPNQFQPSRLPRHPNGPPPFPQQLHRKYEGFAGLKQLEKSSSNPFNYLNFDGKNSATGQNNSNPNDFI